MVKMLPVEEACRRGAEVGVSREWASVNAFRAMLNHPEGAGAVAKLLLTLLEKNKIEARQRELIVLRIGWRAAAEYEFCSHVKLAKRIGLNEEEILGVRDPDRCSLYSELDRAIIKMTDELLDGFEISTATRAVLEKAFTPEQFVELLLAVGNWRLFAIFLKNVAVPLDQDTPGWPQGRAPR
ncbi:MAG: carboxymuconolactone decarboxylase family protein [Candidatus Binataceae bacterium]|nr:carboxymuconolactone decarboxylase family protein [Candidatus Binataceae bacterium]